MVGVRPTTLVGHPRTNHQSVMEHGGVRPAHLVGHPSLRSRQGNPGSEYQAGVVRGRHSITADQWRELNQTASSADSPPAASIWKKCIACGRYPGGWSDSNEQRNAVLVRSAPPHCHDQFGLCDDVRSTPPFLPPAISDRKIRFPGNREPWFWRCRRNEGGHSQIGSRGTLAVALAACPNADQYAASPMISCCRAHSMGRSHRRAIPKPWGRCPSIAALTRSGARKASDTVMLTLRALHPVRLAMLSVVAAGSSISSLSQRRPCAIAATSVAFVSDRMGRGRCCDGSAGRRISRRLVGGVFLQGMWSVFVPSGWLPSAAPVWFNLTINRSGLTSIRST